MRKIITFRYIRFGLYAFAVFIILHCASRQYISSVEVSFRENFNLFRPAIRPANCSEKHQVLLIVTSYVGHVDLRSAHRRSMSQRYLDKFNTTRVFLLAQIPQTEKLITQNSIQNESKLYNDILQGSFIENYRNLTYKHLMGLDWAGSNCKVAKYVIKLDDDTVFDFEKIYSLLNDYGDDKIIVGYVLNGTKPHREKQNKWFVSFKEYAHEIYPDYVSGWLYITTPSTATSLVRQSAHHPYFWIDDIYITGILAKELNIELINLKQYNIWLEYYELMECCLRDMMRKNIKCDYAVSPNGGRNNLIYEFNKALHHCKASNRCKNKSDKQLLKNTCIVEAERTVFGQGESQVKILH